MMPRGAAVDRILVVEDDAMIAMMIADMCEALGHDEPAQAATIDAALAVLEEAPPAAALLDVHLDGAVVWPVADALAARAIPFAFITGGGGEVPAAHAARPTLAKPFRLADLDSLFRALLAQRLADSQSSENR